MSIGLEFVRVSVPDADEDLLCTIPAAGRWVARCGAPAVLVIEQDDGDDGNDAQVDYCCEIHAAGVLADAVKFLRDMP